MGTSAWGWSEPCVWYEVESEGNHENSWALINWWQCKGVCICVYMSVCTYAMCTFSSWRFWTLAQLTLWGQSCVKCACPCAWLLSTQFTKRVKGRAVLGEWIRTVGMHICLPSSPLDSTYSAGWGRIAGWQFQANFGYSVTPCINCKTNKGRKTSGRSVRKTQELLEEASAGQTGSLSHRK